jgi:hypothetical protein
MNEAQLVNESYEQLVKTVFTQFYQATVLARTPEEKAKAEQLFQTGINFARQVRDRAVAILPPV